MDHDALADLHRLKYRYFRTLDLKLWDEFADTLTEDASARYGTQVYGDGLALQGREAITGFMREKLPPSVITVHFAHHPEIDVDGDDAQGTWGFEDTVIVPDFKTLIRGAGYYVDRYRRGADGVWRTAEISYERIYESMESLDDTPSFKLIANRWATAAS